MTVTVAPNLPAPPQATFSGTGGSEVALEAGTFAGLLLGQMQPVNSESPLMSGLNLPKLAPPSENKETNVSKEDEEPVGVSDPSVLALLSVGIQPIQSTHISDPKFSCEMAEKAPLGLPNTLGRMEQNLTSPPPDAETAAFDLGLSAKDKSTLGLTADFAAPTPPPELGISSANAAISNAIQAPGDKPSEINSPIHSEKWPTQFGEKLVWLAKNEVQSAQININPPQLGPIQINLTLNGDQATAVFASPHAEVRHAIEDAMPQLKEMLSSAGINLGQSDVGSNMPQQQTFSNSFQNSHSPKNTDENAILLGNNSMSETSPPTLLRQGNGMVDLFA